MPRGRVRYPPIRTVNSPKMITPPCAVMSSIRAAGKPQTRTVKDPNTITSGGPTHVNMSVTRACGSPPVSTVTAQGGRMGPPTCGTSTVNIGQTCMSVARAAGNMLSSISRPGLQRKPVVFSLWHPRRHGCLHGTHQHIAIGGTPSLLKVCAPSCRRHQTAAMRWRAVTNLQRRIRKSKRLILRRACTPRGAIRRRRLGGS